MFVTITVTDSTFGVSSGANFGHERRWCLALVVRGEMTGTESTVSGEMGG